MARHSNPEQSFQIAATDYLCYVLPKSYWFTAIGHGGGGSIRGALLKAMGLKRGVADHLVLGPNNFVLWLEYKSKRGALSPEQKAFRDMVEMFGHRHGMCRDLNDVRNVLLVHGILRK